MITNFFTKGRKVAVLACLTVIATVGAVYCGGSQQKQISSSPEKVALSATAVRRAEADDDSWVTATNLYQIFPAKFTAQGTLGAMTEKIEYLKDLGVKTVWLMPVFKAMSPHGYNTIDYRTIASNYGTTQDLKTFVAAAHEADIRVLLDLVINHIGSENPWFIGEDGARHDDWFIWAERDLAWDDPWGQDSPPREGRTWFKDPKPDLDRNHNGNAHDDDYFYCVFCAVEGDKVYADMPDLNWKAALAQIEAGQESPLFNEVESIMKYWIDEAGVDGYRADAVRYLVENGKPSLNRDQSETHKVWKELRRRLTAISSGAVLVAEAPTENYDQMRAYYGTADQKEFQGAFHFIYQSVLMGTVKNGWRASNFFNDLDAIQSHLPYDSANQRLLAQDFVFLSNHDSFTGSRVATQLGADKAKIKLAGSVYLLLSGNPVTYYGEEYGMQNVPGESGDNAIRGAMDWSEVEKQKDDPSSVYKHYEGLLRIRNHYPALRAGRSIAIPSKNDGESGFDGPTVESSRISLMREYYGEKILVITNLSGSTQNIHLDLGASGLPAVNTPSPVTVLMGGGINESISQANIRNYPVGVLQPYCTRVLFLGEVPEAYKPLAYYEPGGTGAGWALAYFRGTPNGWTSTEMTKNAEGLWETVQTFDAGNPRFKISRRTDWSEAYPAQDYQVGTGTYHITFDEASKAIEVKSENGSWAAAYFRGTPNNWETTPMTRNAEGLWETVQTFGADNPRFKISRHTDWSEAYPEADYQISAGAGAYRITFDESSKKISVTSGGWSNAYFRGTPNAWKVTSMVRNPDGLWETTQAFESDDPRFKISRFTNWSEAYPTSDYRLKNGAGTYRITFDDSAKTITANVSSGSWSTAYFRGTPNSWNATPMVRNASGQWETTQTFGATNPRFKISHNQDWLEAYPPSDYRITTGAGTYRISFDEPTKAITVTKVSRRRER